MPESPYWKIYDEATYRVQRQVARGGMGAVYEAYKLGVEGFEKRVAHKVLLTSLSQNDEFVTMFVQEAKLVADLVHENVVQIYLRSLYPDDALNSIVDPSVPDPYFERLGIEL
ncbi:MAG: hypothetical protein JKY65_03200 [Planctomycetes bacterium]|nr:hypothetical protein [Planctomycetota bacterium]